VSVTLRAINAALKAKGYPDELVRMPGYFYFWGPNASNWYSSSVATMHLGGWTVDQWVEHYERMAKTEGR